MHPSETPSSHPAQPDPTLALFDLDYTLLPIDSDYEWARFLIRLGVVVPTLAGAIGALIVLGIMVVTGRSLQKKSS